MFASGTLLEHLIYDSPSIYNSARTRLLLSHLSKHPSFSNPAVMSAFLNDAHPVLEESIPEIFCQPRGSRDVSLMLSVSLGCNPVVERPCLVPDGFEIARRELVLVFRGPFRLLTRITLPTARAGALARRHPTVYPTVPSRISVSPSLLGVSVQS